MVHNLLFVVDWQFLAIDESLIIGFFGCYLELDKTVVEHSELTVIRLARDTSEDDIWLWVICSSTDLDGISLDHY